MVVNVMLLSKAASYQPSFVLVNRTIRPKLGLENPFTANNICAKRTWYQLPNLVSLKRIKLLFHSSSPGRLKKGSTMRSCMTTIGIISNRTIDVCLGAMNIIVALSDHWMNIHWAETVIGAETVVT
jgi:hypothetical protein